MRPPPPALAALRAALLLINQFLLGFVYVAVGVCLQRPRGVVYNGPRSEGGQGPPPVPHSKADSAPEEKIP